MKAILVLTGLGLAFSGACLSAANAQTTYIRPMPFNQGYSVTTPGQLPTYIRPMPFNQGYTVTTPGQLPTYIRPLPFNQGYTVQDY